MPTMFRKSVLFLLCCSTVSALPLLATTHAAAEDFRLSGSLRGRFELVDWASPAASAPEATYGYASSKLQLGAEYKKDFFTAELEGQYSQSYDLPGTAVGPGAANRAANSDRHSPGSVFIRRAAVQGVTTLREDTLRAKLGRFLYTSGREVQNGDRTLEWLKRRRIAGRLIADYDYWFGRSFDGVRLDYQHTSWGTFTTSALRPTEGILAVDGMEQIHGINLVTAVFSVEPGQLSGRSDAQFFYYFYEDERGAVLTDNRPEAVSAADRSSIENHSFGFHWLKLYGYDDVKIDSLTWAVLQFGNWGVDDHLAAAWAIEAGVRFEKIFGRPWLRAGWNFGSGDSDPNDGDHTTFNPMLTAARNYARTPFFNRMNNNTLFTQVFWQPHRKISVRSDLQTVWLANTDDLLYFGVGPSRQDSSDFGVGGLPSGGDRYVGTLLDLTVNTKIRKWLTLELYAGHVFGGDVLRNNFSDEDIDYAFVQLTAQR